MSAYQADYVKEKYDSSKHMGFYYELAFRDLYPSPPMCDCQATTKVPNNGTSTYHEDFTFQCGSVKKNKWMHMNTDISMTPTDGKTTGVWAQEMQKVRMDWPTDFTIPVSGVAFHTTIVAFKESSDPADSQYDWVIEFTCGEDSGSFLANLLFDHFFPGGFVGINMYSKKGPHDSNNLNEMIEEAKSLGLAWTMDDWGWGFHKVPHNSTCKYDFGPHNYSQEQLEEL